MEARDEQAIRAREPCRSSFLTAASDNLPSGEKFEVLHRHLFLAQKLFSVLPRHIFNPLIACSFGSCSKTFGLFKSVNFTRFF